MNIRQIRHFVAVLEHGSVLGAARAIHISQPALSKSITNLEAELGVPLLERRPRGVSPTVYGAAFLKHARLTLNQTEQARAEIEALKAGQLGHLRLGVANFAISILPEVLSRLLASRPGLSVDIIDGTYEGLAELLREGAIDAFVSGLPPLHQVEGLIHEELQGTEFVRVCRPGYQPFCQRDLALRAMSGARWILPNRPRAILDLWELAFHEARLVPPKPALVSGSMMFIKGMLLAGDFLTVLPRDIVAREVKEGGLVAHQLPGPYGQVMEGIVYRADGTSPPALFALIESIKEESRQATSTATSQPSRPRRRKAVR